MIGFVGLVRSLLLMSLVHRGASMSVLAPALAVLAVAFELLRVCYKLVSA